MNGVITKIRTELNNVFNQVLDVFATREDSLYYKPENDGWGIYEVLEHLVLANYFLLRVINKQTERALQVVKHVDGTRSINDYSLDINKLKEMELTGSYVWVPQRYTEPGGDMPLLQLKMALHDQLHECLGTLQNQRVVEAIMRTHEAGKLDALHYLYFLTQHMQRHLGQIGRVKKEFYQQQKQITHTNNIPVSSSMCLN